MTIEQSLAARKISQLWSLGYSKESVITQTTKFLKSQGFGAAHSATTAKTMFDLVA